MKRIKFMIFASVFVIVLATFCTFLIGTHYSTQNYDYEYHLIEE